MQHIYHLKNPFKYEWKNLEIYEKIDGFRFGVSLSEDELVFMKRNDKKIHKLDVMFFPPYFEILKYMEKNKFSIKGDSFFEVIHLEDKIKIIQTSGEEFYPDDMDEKFEFLKLNSLNSKDDSFFIEKRIKEMNENDSYYFLYNLFQEKLIFQKNEGFVFKFLIQNKEVQYKLINPDFKFKFKEMNSVKFKYEDLLTEESLNYLDYCSVTLGYLDPIEFANRVYNKIILLGVTDNLKEDTFGILQNYQDYKISDSIYKDILNDRKKMSIYKICALYKKKDNEKKNI